MNKYFESFYENIQITASQAEDAKTKYTGVCEKLHDNYYPTSEYDGSTKFLIGSYAKDTHVRPARDVDVIFVMPQDKFNQYNDNQSNCQAQLLQDIKKILEEKYPNTPIKAFGKVVVLEFSDTKHNVELLPAWENSDKTFTIPNSENSGSWERWDPRSEINKINESDKITNKTRKMVRMIKKWSENCTVNLKSYEIESQVIAYFVQSSNSEAEFSLLIRGFFDDFAKAVIDENTKSHLITAFNRANKACEHEKAGNFGEAATEWKKIFGDDFPAFISTDKLLELQIRYPSPKEEFLESNYNIATAIDSKYRVKIDAEVKQNGFRIDLLSSFLLKGWPLKKRKSLIFKIVNNTAPKPYRIMWKVRNYGEEAKIANDLRGEITDDRGSEEKIENTKYQGEHYVECYVVKNNVCVATAHLSVPVNNDY